MNELVRKETLAEMHRVQMAMNSPFDAVFGEDLNLFGYGLGWMVGLYKNHYTVNHGGGIDGFISSVVLFPKEKIGIVILTNTDSRGVFPMAAAYGIADCLMGEEKGDWLLQINEKQEQFKKILKPEKEDSLKKGAPEIRSLDAYLGEFEHPGYGVIDITLGETGLVASYNKIFYSLEHRCYDHFTGKMQSDPLGRSGKLDALFMSNALGEISQFQISLEPTLPPIVFKKRAQQEFLKVGYLKRFEGDFEGEFFSINICLKKDHLMATIEGQPSCEMCPEKEGLFSLKEVPGCFLRFVAQEEGASFKLSLEQAGQTFSLVKRS